MRIQNNMMAINTHRQLAINQSNQAKSTEKLSSGYKINRAADDAAGLSISEKMRAQVRGLNRASANAQDGISMIQAAEGALQESHSILQRMRELAVQGSNGVPAAEDRDAVLSELEQLGEELNRIATTTNFNGKYLLSGYYADDSTPTVDEGDHDGATPAAITVEGIEPDAINLQVGANSNVNDVIKVQIQGVGRVDLLGEAFGTKNTFLKEGASYEALRLDAATGHEAGEDPSEEMWQGLMNVIDGRYDASGQTAQEASTPEAPGTYTGLARVSELRSMLGAVQNRLEHTVANVDTVAENVQSAESRIRDTDMAKEMMNFTKNNILNQAATAMLAQANQAPQTVLQLLQ